MIAGRKRLCSDVARRVLASLERRSWCARRRSYSRGYCRASTSESRVLEETVVLGVETSCDDTGVAVMKGDGQLLGNCLQSQTQVHKT